MGLFGWLKQLFGGAPAEKLVPRYSGEGICPYCGQSLKTAQAQQCFVCGADWHDPYRVVRHGTPSAPAAETNRSDTVVERTSTATVVPTSTTTTVSEPAKPKRGGGLDNLEMGQFAPLSNDQVKSQARGLGSLWGNPWFGRRDLIPPTSDARTELIDRAMVGQGLITAEELTEIHRVGEEMDRIRPDLALARQAGDQAVARSQEERERIKEQKRAEAAERRRKRAEEIAHRRQTDIVFLGRGVSRGLADRRANVERLEQLELPLLATPADVAQRLGLEIPQLRWLAFHTEAATRSHYIDFTVPKKSGGERRLSAPHRSIARCQQWILKEILAKVSPHDAAHGFVSGRSTVTNATPHLGKEVVVNADLEDFFPTISFSRVKGTFRSLGYSPAAATILALLCTEAPRRQIQYDNKTYYVATAGRCLPQGACTSPALSNLVSRRLDKRLSGIAGKLGWTYTRYADDMTFSAGSDAASKVAYLMARLRHITQDEGFSVNEKKTRVQRQKTRQSVTGIVVNQRAGIPRPVVRRIRAILHRAKFEGLAAQNRDDLPHFESWLLGMIAYISMVNPDQGRPLREAYDKLSA